MDIFLVFAVLTAIYIVAIIGLVGLLRRLRIGGNRAIALGFVIFGLLSGLLAARAWPLDSSVYANVYAVLLGDQVYSWAIRCLGDPNSANAHGTIPWILRVPQVYVLVSLVVNGLAGLAVKWLFGKRIAGKVGGAQL